MCLILLGSLCLAACHSNDGTFDPIGRWSSKEGYEVTLRTNGTYLFCDRGVCSEGKVERPGGGFGVTLVGFFKKENTARLVQEVRRLYTGYAASESFGKDSDLDFTANSGISTASPSEFCDYKPCVIFGSLETGPNLAFIKAE